MRTQQELGVLVLLLVELGLSLHRDDKLEFAGSHPFQLLLQPVWVPSEELHDFRFLDMVDKLDGLGVIHHARNSAIERLRSQRSPDT